ncbi:unnamed protein product, partial [Prorocentrum cordatum]
DNTSELSKLVLSEFDRRADHLYPYRATLRLSVAECAAAWRDLVVNLDQGSWTMQAERADLKRASTARHAAKMSWKKLCHIKHRVSWDGMKNLLLEKAYSPLDNVKALARSLLVLVNLTERGCTVAKAAKRSGVEKAAAQKSALVDRIYHAIA